MTEDSNGTPQPKETLTLWLIVGLTLFAPFAALNGDIQPAFNTKCATIVKFQMAAFSCPGTVWDTAHHAHPDLCPTLQRANITSNATIKAAYRLQLQYIKLHAAPKRLAKLASEYHN